MEWPPGRHAGTCLAPAAACPGPGGRRDTDRRDLRIRHAARADPGLGLLHEVPVLGVGTWGRLIAGQSAWRPLRPAWRALGAGMMLHLALACHEIVTSDFRLEAGSHGGAPFVMKCRKATA